MAKQEAPLALREFVFGDYGIKDFKRIVRNAQIEDQIMCYDMVKNTCQFLVVIDKRTAMGFESHTEILCCDLTTNEELCFSTARIPRRDYFAPTSPEILENNKNLFLKKLPSRRKTNK